MKRYILLIIIFAMLLSLCACNKNSSIPAVSISTEHEPTGELLLPEDTQGEVNGIVAAVSVPAQAELYYDEAGNPMLSCVYQEMTLVLPNPNISTKIIAQFQSKNQHIIEKAIPTDFTADDTLHICRILYSPTRIDHDVLSLYGNQLISAGYARPIANGISLNFDLLSGDPLTLGSIMHPGATMTDFQRLVTEKLDRIADDYSLFDDYKDAVSLRFSADPSQYEAFYFSTTGLCFFFDLYEIAPASSGIISIEIPYEELSGLMNDAYFPAERDMSDAQVTIGNFNITDMNQFETITEAVITQTGDMIVISSNSEVYDISVEAYTSDEIHSCYTVYAAYMLRENEAVVIEGTDTQLQEIQISYTDRGGRHTIS